MKLLKAYFFWPVFFFLTAGTQQDSDSNVMAVTREEPPPVLEDPEVPPLMRTDSVYASLLYDIYTTPGLSLLFLDIMLNPWNTVNAKLVLEHPCFFML